MCAGRGGEALPTSWVAIFLAVMLFPVSLGAQDAANFFEGNCTLCHTVGEGPRAGPDLQDVTQRKDRDWLIRFVSASLGRGSGGFDSGFDGCDFASIKSSRAEASSGVTSGKVGMTMPPAASRICRA